jgi:hypothetical protein
MLHQNPFESRSRTTAFHFGRVRREKTLRNLGVLGVSAVSLLLGRIHRRDAKYAEVAQRKAFSRRTPNRADTDQKQHSFSLGLYRRWY